MAKSSLKSLPGLRKISSLPEVNHSPVDGRLTEDLIASWMPLISSLMVKYEINGRLDAPDIRQELVSHIWGITKRIDPIAQPIDFQRLCRTELRNKCVDLTRHAKARKRMGRTGKAAQCGCCGSVTRTPLTGIPECEFCGETVDVRTVDIYSKEVSIYDTDDNGNATYPNSVIDDPSDKLIKEEMIDQVGNLLEGTDILLYSLMVSPPSSFLEFVFSKGYTCDHRQVPMAVFSSFLGTTDKNISLGMRRIKSAISDVCGGSLSESALGRAASRQGR